MNLLACTIRELCGLFQASLSLLQGTFSFFFFLEEPKFCDLEVQLLFLMLLSPFLEPFWFQLLPNDISVRCDGRSKEFVAAFG